MESQISVKCQEKLFNRVCKSFLGKSTENHSTVMVHSSLFFNEFPTRLICKKKIKKEWLSLTFFKTTL